MPRWRAERGEREARKPPVTSIDQALRVEGPAIVDCVVPADEMPNFPHVDLEKAENFAKAKIKEMILAVTGG